MVEYWLITVSNNGEWRQWSEWGACSVSCGKGMTTRWRACSGNRCIGLYSEGKSCMEQKCSPPPSPGGAGIGTIYIQGSRTHIRFSSRGYVNVVSFNNPSV